MVFQRKAVGLDLGTHSVKAVQVRLDGSEAVIEQSLIVSREDLEFEREDPDDPGELAARVAERMEEAGISTRGVVFGIDGKEAILRYTNMPPMASKRLETVMKYEVESVADRMEEALATDYVILPIRREDGEQTILLGLAKEAELVELLDGLESEGITVRVAVPGALALYGGWELYGTKPELDAPEDDLVLAIDVGAANVHIALILDGRLAFARSATFGGEQFTAALSDALGISQEDAERAKIARGGLDESQRGVLAETVAPLRGVAGQLLGMVQSSIRFCGSQAGLKLPPVSRLWVTGGGMRLRGLPEYLAKALGGQPVEVFDPAAPGEKGEGLPPSSLGPALGLAATGLLGEGGNVPSLNIIPSKYRERRRFRERTVYLYAAAVMLGVFILAQLVYGVSRRWEANALRAELMTEYRSLERRRAERDESQARTGEIQARLERLFAEARPTTFQAFVLDLLAATLRPEMKIDGIRLDTPERQDGSGGVRYELVIDGRASDEGGKGLDWITELQETLMGEERVSDVVVVSSQREGPWYTFTMVVVPKTMRI